MTVEDVLSHLKRYVLDLDVLQWLVPAFLALVALSYEVFEHWVERGVALGSVLRDRPFFSEIFIFGLMGPTIIAVIIAWMRRLMMAERKATLALQELNRELEAKVTERTLALEQRNLELARANRELQRLDEMKSEFVALVSHELSAPLTALNGGLELALQHADSLPPLARRTLQTMARESERLTRFVQAILDISRLDAGRLRMTFGPVAVRPLLEHAVEATLLTGERRVEWRFEGNIPPVWADEVYLEEIVRILVGNADKYSEPGALVHLSVSLDERYVRIAVMDHGPGIPPERREDIFDRFTRVHTDEDAPRGWGLGLYFARRLIEAQGGQIGVRSPVWDDPRSPGTEFYLLVPIAKTPDGDL